ncbi:sugar ABC transporter ATPase [Burkholderia sp. WAC0059]|uniref:sugar ABC transporter ATPase n=1 Tax=Burkholderia sp. WAC0059 TaxID=2066022 RepID=UPI000C7F447C|nr:sugar ABC transporter ATPase [Burkholderia sp. WAC0059]PLZ04316.1 sugar ABC transporter ATPase [Burkholderia sp. WAC0059]
MKALLPAVSIVSVAALLAACGSAPGNPADAAAATPMIYIASTRPASSVAECLEDRLPRVHEDEQDGVTELTVGSRSHASYFVALAPSPQGSTVRVTQGTSNDPPEAELRYDIARCAI